MQFDAAAMLRDSVTILPELMLLLFSFMILLVSALMPKEERRLIAWLSSVMLLTASADTVTVSFTLPISSVMSISAVAAARTSTPGRSYFLKFVVTTSTRYVPGLMLAAS